VRSGTSIRSARRCRRSARTKPASPCRKACTVPAGRPAARSAVPGSRSSRCTQTSWTSGPTDRSCTSAAEGTSTRTRAGTPAGSRGSAAAMAGRAASSPTSRCQSASRLGVYAPPGPPSYVVVSRASVLRRRAQMSVASPVSPADCTPRLRRPAHDHFLRAAVWLRPTEGYREQHRTASSTQTRWDDPISRRPGARAGTGAPSRAGRPSSRVDFTHATYQSRHDEEER
jgi:hypothetical protein